jgi:hypothetical protein
MHLDMFQRIQVDPCSLSMVRYTPLRPFVLRINDTGVTVTSPPRADSADAAGPGAQLGKRDEGDAVVGGGAGG